MATKSPLDGTEPSSRAGGRPPALKPEHIAVLHDILMERAGQLARNRRRTSSPLCFTRVRSNDSSRARYRTAQAGTPDLRCASRRNEAVWLHSSPQARGHLATQHQPDRCGMGAGCRFVRTYAGTARQARALQSPRSRPRVFLRAAHRLRMAAATGAFPPWHAVYKAFSRWVGAGVFEQMQDRLREQWRIRMGPASTPSAAVIDAQSPRISPQGGESGFDAGKKIKGRKRHLVVDTMGLLIAVSVTAASVHDRAALQMPHSWFFPCAGSSKGPMRGLNAGAAR